jgi:hypothetical protein
MTDYTVTIRHHSIAYAPRFKFVGDLAKAKRFASREFRGEFLDHEICIFEYWNGQPELVSSRKVGARRWQDAIR